MRAVINSQKFEKKAGNTQAFPITVKFEGNHPDDVIKNNRRSRWNSKA